MGREGLCFWGVATDGGYVVRDFLGIVSGVGVRTSTTTCCWR